ncbi:uncharacterized protein LOC117171666 [Belonocnema kinseyi]|uniref:uncharacterized protein LOC117171666 n=1 Tax=Belonocnema kinseyi TaxID=2817044 RepID=UPI00143D70F4|nr:uncharacterized protein LOC117171666 [Belonocnema kinseyi]
MYQPLYDNYSQPIAVFTSKGPTKSTDLAKLIIQAIVLVERAGATIHGVVSDGATTNRKFWSELRMSGKKDNLKNWFIHPSDEKRKVFAFSDICHLIKNVRNRMENKEVKLKVHPDDSFIDWSHFHTIYDLYKPKPQGKSMSKFNDEPLSSQLVLKNESLICSSDS